MARLNMPLYGKLNYSLYGKQDTAFTEFFDPAGPEIIPIDFNAFTPYFIQPSARSFSICESSFKRLYSLFLRYVKKSDRKQDLLILMRIKKSPNLTKKTAARMAEKIVDVMEGDCQVLWAAQEYSTYRFDFHFYDNSIKLPNPIKTPSQAYYSIRGSKNIRQVKCSTCKMRKPCFIGFDRSKKEFMFCGETCQSHWILKNKVWITKNFPGWEDILKDSTRRVYGPSSKHHVMEK